MKVSIIIPNALSGKFSEVKLGYEYGSINVQAVLNIDINNLYKFTREKDGVGFDIFMLGCFVYGIDILLPRKKISKNGWTRDIEVEFPVGSPDIFNNGQQELEQALSFLTGDYWQISFIQRNVRVPLYKPKPSSKVFKDTFRKSHKTVSLFSGGLDSLIGVIDQLSKHRDRIVLVSHYDSVFKGAKRDQDEIIKVLYNNYSHFHFLQTRVDLSSYDVNGVKIDKESTLRSRSFLFICQAIFVAHSIGEGVEVLIPENGTISLNHPLTVSRRSSCSTRTAHPFYLVKVGEYISKLGFNHLIKNKYEMKTKGEMLEECEDTEALLATYKLSCSCAKRGHNANWDIREVSHCGVCMPCLYRRVALHKIGIDNETLGTDLFNPIKYDLEKLPDMPAFLDYIKPPLSKDEIGRNLLVNGTLPLAHVDQYADVVYRARIQIIDWIREKGSAKIKQLLDLQ